MAKSKKPAGGGGSPNSNSSNDFVFGKAELVVITKPEVGLRANKDGMTSRGGLDVSPLAKMMEYHKTELKPLFGLSEDRILERMTSRSPESAKDPASNLSLFYHIDAPEEELDQICKELNELDTVEAAYVKPPAALAALTMEEEISSINEMQPAADEAPATTPNFIPRQIYLNPAPAGIDAKYAWTVPGGRGNNVKVIDCEWGWNFTHEDLTQSQMGVVVGSATTQLNFQNHGTAVIGEIGGDRNAFGVTGIAPDAIVGAASFVSKPTAQTIREAADKLNKGDILLLEIHRAGPNSTGSGQFGYIAVEWWPDDYAAIRYAVNKGIIVVEAAGNGAQNFDTAVYNTRPSGFPASWKNPLNPANPSSGAVVVGAGAPPPGTHGRDHGPDRSRLGFSNYGKRVDCQGWGREVTSTGYGDLQGGGSRNVWYTNTFSGTSSASPIIVGALACVQGVLKSQGSTPLTSYQAINLLRTTGTPQTDAPGRPKTQRIGNRPNLRQMIPSVADRWFNNRTVIRTHVKYHSKMAWVIINGSGWLRIAPTSADGVTNILVTLNEALANNRKVDVYIKNGQILQITLK